MKQWIIFALPFILVQCGPSYTYRAHQLALYWYSLSCGFKRLQKNGLSSFYGLITGQCDFKAIDRLQHMLRKI